MGMVHSYPPAIARAVNELSHNLPWRKKAKAVRKVKKIVGQMLRVLDRDFGEPSVPRPVISIDNRKSKVKIEKVWPIHCSEDLVVLYGTFTGVEFPKLWGIGGGSEAHSRVDETEILLARTRRSSYVSCAVVTVTMPLGWRYQSTKLAKDYFEIVFYKPKRVLPARLRGTEG